LTTTLTTSAKQLLKSVSSKLCFKISNPLENETIFRLKIYPKFEIVKGNRKLRSNDYE